MKILVISILADDGSINPGLNNLLGAAQYFEAPIDVLLLGVGEVNLGKFAYLNQVMQLTVSGNQLLATNIADFISSYAKNYTHVLMAADSYGKDILPRVAGILDVAQISEVIKICSPNIFKRPIYAGNIIAEVEAFDEIKLLTIRVTSFVEVQFEFNQNCLIHHIDSEVITTDNITKVVSQINQQPTQANVSSGLSLAKKIVSGGKSLTSKENFTDLIGGLANKINAYVGASRDAVEAGLISNDHQVGQTGKVVAPNLYIAIGISGAVQHIAGMKDSKTVLAINIDPTAQIFEYSDYGFEGDLFEVIPQLIEKLS